MPTGVRAYRRTKDCGFENHIVSTEHGVLAPTSSNGRFPDVSDLGEVVYADLFGSALSVISTERGDRFAGPAAKQQRE